MPRRKKIGMIMLFSSGVACIFIATLRAAQITANTIRTKDPVDGTWLALWGIVESAIGTFRCSYSKTIADSAAVIVGCCPSFAVLMHAVKRRSRKLPNNAGRRVMHVDQVDLETIGRMSACRRNRQQSLGTIDLIWSDEQSGREGSATDQSKSDIRTRADTFQY